MRSAANAMKMHSREWFLQQRENARNDIERWPEWMKEGRTVATAHFQRVPAAESSVARSLLRRASAQLLAWNELYGRLNTNALPPAGDIRLAEDIEEFLSPNVAVEPQTTAPPKLD